MPLHMQLYIIVSWHIYNLSIHSFKTNEITRISNTPIALYIVLYEHLIKVYG